MTDERPMEFNNYLNSVRIYFRNKIWLTALNEQRKDVVVTGKPRQRRKVKE